MNAGAGEYRELFILNEEGIEVVLRYKYLGTLVSNDGSRTDDFEARLKDAQGVLNEIAQVCKSYELSVIRLQYVNLLIESCFK